MIPGVWTKWSHERPPRDVLVEGAWNDDDTKKDKPTRGYVCKRGCCFNADFGAGLIPPLWWRVPEPGAGL